MTGFWQLPAPATFLRRVVEDLREGNNVVVAIPNHAPSGWPTALRSSLADPVLPRLKEIQTDGSAPIPTLHKELALGPCSPRATIADLCANAGFQSRLLHIQRFTPPAWQAWSAFLCEYEDACRHLGLAQRTLFIATIQGDLAAQSPQPANLLRVHHWLDCVDSLNIRLHAAGLLSATTLPHWHRQLAVALLAELALWDPDVLTAGAALPLADIMEPEPWLSQIALTRGWSPSDDPSLPEAAWQGLRQNFENRRRTHSAWLALAGRREALDLRVWNGQVSALFPLLEQHRRGLLSTHSRLLRVPWSTQYGSTINNLEDLELNHIADQLRIQNSRGLSDLCTFVNWLRDVRNDLAHLTPVEPNRLLDPRFQSRMGTIPTHEDD